MRLQEALEELSERVDPSTVSLLGRHIPFEWIEQAIASSEGMATLRKRRLPASQVIWLVLGMALFRKHPIDDLVDKLDLALPDPRFPTVAPSAVSQARARVGEEPMQRLFDRCSSQWAHDSADSDRWRGLAVYGVDVLRSVLPTPPKTASISAAKAPESEAIVAIHWCAQ
jgi:hypothetical protein